MTAFLLIIAILFILAGIIILLFGLREKILTAILIGLVLICAGIFTGHCFLSEYNSERLLSNDFEYSEQ